MQKWFQTYRTALSQRLKGNLGVNEITHGGGTRRYSESEKHRCKNFGRRTKVQHFEKVLHVGKQLMQQISRVSRSRDIYCTLHTNLRCVSMKESCKTFPPVHESSTMMANILGLVQLLCHTFRFYELCYELSFALLLEFKMTSDNAWLCPYQASNPNLHQLLHVFIFHAAELHSLPSELPPALIPDTYPDVSAATKRIRI